MDELALLLIKFMKGDLKMDAIAQKWYNWCVSIANSSNYIIIGILIIALVIVGIYCMLGEEARTKAKKAFIGMGIGVFIALGAVTIANAFASSVAF